tara:strand:- start:272 stop:1162 length:891 start_codon:yes stop_codon:yes gene_type:complete
MNKYLIFRTDRVGDFLLTSILINSIKRNDPYSHISIVASEKNYNYIKTFTNINEIFLLKNKFTNKLKCILKLRKNFYDVIIIHDEKNRSFFISRLCKYKKRIIIKKSLVTTHINKIKKILLDLNFNFKEQDLDILKNRNNQNIKIKEKFALLHFDEKWIFYEYIKEYTNIEPSEYQLEKFINSIYSKLNIRLIITTGINTSQKLNNVIKNINNSNISLFSNLKFIDLENIVLQANLIIACHGAISHIGSANNIKQIDIIEYKKLEFYKLWTDHFRNHIFLYRKNFDELSNDIIMLL